MPVGTIGLGFAELNRLRRFPLADDATVVDVTGAFTVPNDLLVGLVLAVPASLVPSSDRYYLSSIVASPDTLTLGFSYLPASGPAEEIATAVVSRAGHSPYAVYPVVGTNSLFSSLTGHVQVGDFDALDERPSGRWVFAREAGRLDPTTLRFTLPGVSSIVVVDADGQSLPLTGDIRLASGPGTRLRVVTEGGRPTIYFDYVGSSSTFPECPSCVDAQSIPITSINDQPPGPDGNFPLNAGPCVTIVPLATGLRLENPCSEPCYDCTDLEPLTGEHREVVSRVNDLDRAIRRIETQMDRLETVVTAGAA